MPILYQRSWNGVDLIQIARDPTRLDHGIPNAAFYAEYYRQLRAVIKDLPSHWLDVKRKNSELLAAWLEATGRNLGVDPNKLSLLSVGAGLGIIELPLVAMGYRVTLHDVQAESLQHASDRARQAGLEVEVVTGPLDAIGRRFDVVYVGLVEYCLAEQSEYLRFLSDVRSLVSDRGRLIAADLEPSIRTYLAAATAGYRRGNGIRWGRLRSGASRSRALMKSGFNVIAHELYNSDLQLLATGSGPAGRRLPSLRSDFAALHAVRRP